VLGSTNKGRFQTRRGAGGQITLPDPLLRTARQTLEQNRIGALIVLGGDGSLRTALHLARAGLPVIGVPKTIDNDLESTDVTFGFDTAINIVVDSVEKLRTTTASHRRIMVVETMGRHAGWIACFSGIAVGADYIMVPEVPVDIDHCCDVLKKRLDDGKKYAIVVVSEGAKMPNRKEVTTSAETDAFGHVRLGGIGQIVAEKIEERLQRETRSVTLGHIQRGGPPSAYDRVLATRLGLAAGDLVLKKRFGTMVALSGTKIIETTLKAGVAASKTLDLTYYAEASAFFK